MTVTHSNDDNDDNNSQDYRRIYKGQLNGYDVTKINDAYVEFLVQTYKSRQQEYFEFGRDLIILLKQYAQLNGRTYLTNEEEDYFVGPNSENTRTANTALKMDWHIKVVSKTTKRHQIKTAIEEMRIYGFRRKVTPQARLDYERRNKEGWKPKYNIQDDTNPFQL